MGGGKIVIRGGTTTKLYAWQKWLSCMQKPQRQRTKLSGWGHKGSESVEIAHRSWFLSYLDEQYIGVIFSGECGRDYEGDERISSEVGDFEEDWLRFKSKELDEINWHTNRTVTWGAQRKTWKTQCSSTDSKLPPTVNSRTDRPSRKLVTLTRTSKGCNLTPALTVCQ